MWPLSSVPGSSLRNSCFCSSVPIRATGEHARPEPPSASAMPAQPHASSSDAATASRAWLFGFFGSGSSSTPVSFLRPSSSAVWMRPSACADFIRSHGIDSSRSCFIAIGRIMLLRERAEHLADAGEQRVVVEEVHGDSWR